MEGKTKVTHEPLFIESSKNGPDNRAASRARSKRPQIEKAGWSEIQKKPM
jgi:hypothetical protein